jgi:uncharacterized protein
MHIHLEAADDHSIQAYNEKEIRVSSIDYQHSLILSREKIISDWPIEGILELNEDLLKPLLDCQPKIILIGHNQVGQFPPMEIRARLAKAGIGLETMSIGAACRTFNVLLNEGREVVLGVIL